MLQKGGLQIITIDRANKKLIEKDVKFGNIKRGFTCLVIEKGD